MRARGLDREDGLSSTKRVGKLLVLVRAFLHTRVQLQRNLFHFAAPYFCFVGFLFNC